MTTISKSIAIIVLYLKVNKKYKKLYFWKIYITIIANQVQGGKFISLVHQLNHYYFLNQYNLRVPLIEKNLLDPLIWFYHIKM